MLAENIIKLIFIIIFIFGVLSHAKLYINEMENESTHHRKTYKNNNWKIVIIHNSFDDSEIRHWHPEHTLSKGRTECASDDSHFVQNEIAMTVTTSV